MTRVCVCVCVVCNLLLSVFHMMVCTMHAHSHSVMKENCQSLWLPLAPSLPPSLPPPSPYAYEFVCMRVTVSSSLVSTALFPLLYSSFLRISLCSLMNQSFYNESITHP